MIAAVRPSAVLARSIARRAGHDVVEVWPALTGGRSRRWRWTRWAPNGQIVGASEEGRSSRARVVEGVRRWQTDVTIVVGGRGGWVVEPRRVHPSA